MSSSFVLRVQQTTATSTEDNIILSYILPVIGVLSQFLLLLSSTMAQISTKNPYKKTRSSNFKFLLILSICVIIFYSSTKSKIDTNKKEASSSNSSSTSTSTSTPETTRSTTKSELASNSSFTIQKDNVPFNKVFNKDMINQCKTLPTSDPKPKDQWTSKSIWFAMLHHTLSDSTHRELINQITGLSNGGKSFYISMKGLLRHCIGNTETATCSTGDLPKDKNRDLFYDKYMMFIRNPKTVFPSSANVKNEKYHDLKGQMSKESWRETRNEWLDGMMDGWVQKIREWRETDYKEGLYVVYEDLMDLDQGPEVVRAIARLLKEAGFEIADDQNMPCIWLKAIGVESIEQFYENGYDYGDYVPGYTKEQQEMMLKKLKSLMEEVGDSNMQLKSILQRYYDDIENNIIIEDN